MSRMLIGIRRVASFNLLVVLIVTVAMCVMSIGLMLAGSFVLRMTSRMNVRLDAVVSVIGTLFVCYRNRLTSLTVFREWFSAAARRQHHGYRDNT
ncbi:MAG: hypothetical protein O3C40_03130 [Planctomycetota bacterium]|nr:hypothetical protein [Planctomycetota bacterium]